MPFDLIGFILRSAIPGDCILVDGVAYQYRNVYDQDGIPTGSALWYKGDSSDCLTSIDIADSGYKVEVSYLASLVYVNAYRVSTIWGGPEEGGWTYEVGESIASVPLSLGQLAGEDIDCVSSQLEVALAGEINRRQEIRVIVQRRFAENWPEERPHYE